MTAEKLIEKLLLCRPDAVVLTERSDILTDYLEDDTLTEAIAVYQGLGYKVVNDARGGQWRGSEPFQNYNEPVPGVPSVYIGTGEAIKEPLWEKK